MDTNKENELMHNLEEKVGGGDTGHLPDGRPTKKDEDWRAVNPPGTSQNVSQQRALQVEAQQDSNAMGGEHYGRRGHFFGQIVGSNTSGSVTNTMLQSDSASDIDKVTPEMVNRIEMYGAEAVYNAGRE